MHTHYTAIILCGVLLSPTLPAGTGKPATSPVPSANTTTEASSASLPAPRTTPAAVRMRLSQAGDEPVPPSYLESVSREAARSDPAGARASADAPTHVPEATAPRPAPTTEVRRFDAIRSIVSDAFAAPKSETAEAAPERKSPESVAKRRRQRLQEVIINAPPAEDSPGDNYISILKDEVSTTVVVEPGIASETMGGAGSATRRTREIDVYTVRHGDSLWTIAERVYGSGYRWSLIYEANRNRITNANVLLVGQRLEIPGE